MTASPPEPGGCYARRHSRYKSKKGQRRDHVVGPQLHVQGMREEADRGPAQKRKVNGLTPPKHDHNPREEEHLRPALRKGRGEVVRTHAPPACPNSQFRKCVLLLRGLS